MASAAAEGAREAGDHQARAGQGRKVAETAMKLHG